MELHSAIMSIREGAGVTAGTLGHDSGLNWDRHPLSATVTSQQTVAVGNALASFLTG